jgi:hypothetical protein
LNSYGVINPTRPSTWRVCQFRHSDEKKEPCPLGRDQGRGDYTSVPISPQEPARHSSTFHNRPSKVGLGWMPATPGSQAPTLST